MFKPPIENKNKNNNLVGKIYMCFQLMTANNLFTTKKEQVEMKTNYVKYDSELLNNYKMPPKKLLHR